MPKGTRIEWSGDDAVKAQMAAYGRKVKEAELRVAQYWAPKLEAAARQSAPWTDRTANARQALRGYTSEDVPNKYSGAMHEYPNPSDLAKDTVALYLSHGMNYGMALETKYQGRYATIMPTLQKFYPEIAKMLKGMFG